MSEPMTDTNRWWEVDAAVAGSPASAPMPATQPIVERRNPTRIALIAAIVVAAVLFAGLRGGSSQAGGSAPTSSGGSFDRSSTSMLERDVAPPPAESATDEQVTPPPPPPADDISPSETSTPSPTGTYRVTIIGETSGRTFERTAELVVTDTIDRVASTNGTNPVDVCLTSGFPAGEPEIGAIWFGSNTGCLPSTNGADIDMTTVTTDDGRIVIEPDEDLMAVGINHFTAEDGLLALLYWIQSGAMVLEFDGDTVSGVIEIRGYCGPCTFGPGSDGTMYRAELQGDRV